jgi:hypothetical protein
MTSVAQPSTASTSSRTLTMRGLVAGGTATTALIAAAVLLFASLATYVAFNTSGGEQKGDSSATIDARASTGAPEAAAARAGAAAAAVAARPAATTAVAPPPAPPAPPIAVPVASTAVSPPPDGGTGTAVVPDEPNGPTSQSGALGSTVGGLQNTAENLGLDVPLTDATNPIIKPLDDTLNHTLNNVGGLLGNPGLGDQVTGSLNDVTNALLGEGGLTDQLLGGNR